MDLGLIQINMLRYVINIQCILKIINRDATFVSTAIQWLWETAYGHNRRSYAKRQKYCHSLMQRRLRSGIHEYVNSGVAGVIVKVMSVVHDQTARNREIIGLLRPDPTRRRAATGRSGRSVRRRHAIISTDRSLACSPSYDAAAACAVCSPVKPDWLHHVVAVVMRSTTRNRSYVKRVTASVSHLCTVTCPRYISHYTESYQKPSIVVIWLFDCFACINVTHRSYIYTQVHISSPRL